LSGNQLTSDSVSWQSLPSLSQLSVLALDQNLLSTIPPEIGLLTSLRYFSAANNQLTSIPDEIGNLTLLDKLDLSYNCIQEVPSSLGTCIQLSEINLTGNRLMSIPASWSQMVFLKRLFLDGNQLKNFPSEILKKCTQLQTLSIHANELTMDDLRELDGWSEFDKRRKDKYSKQIDMQVMVSSNGFDEGADVEQWQKW
jgi:Leucine-rich repeat (LRR) protein